MTPQIFSFGGAGFITGSPVCFDGNASRPVFRGARKGGAAFTVVEMLAVLAIGITLLALTMPAISGWRDSSIRAAAVGQVFGLLQETRSLALTHGRPAYFVVSDRPNPQTGATDPAEAPGLFRYAAIYCQQEDPALPPTAATRWYRLPEGCSFVQEEKSFLEAPEEPTPPALPRPEGSNPLPYLAFNETGGVLHPHSSEYASVRLRTRPAGAPEVITVALYTGRSTCR